MNTSLKSISISSLLFLTAIPTLSASPNASADAALASHLVQQDNFSQLAMLNDEEKSLGFTFAGHKPKESWAFAFDNDILAPGHRDQDYTYGVNWTYSGANAKNAVISLKEPLSAISDVVSILPQRSSLHDNYSHEFGFFGFTPKGNVFKADDRPYASLIYFSSSIEQLDLANNIAWKSSLTLGVLGLGFVGNLQNSVHSSVGIAEAQDWNTQVSDGGEMTGRYVIARQHYIEGLSDSFEVKSTLQASVGYLTETSWSLSIREGKVLSPWASFNPELTSYGEKSTYSSNADAANEHYFWAGVTLKARLYNVFLQGQFRDSTHTYSQDDLRPMMAEAWAGYTFAFKNGYRVSYVLRGQTSEIKQGSGDRNLIWGGLVLSKTM